MPRIDTIALRTPECAPDGWDTGTVTFGHYNKYTKLIRHCAHKVIHSTIDIAVRLYCNHETSRYHWYQLFEPTTRSNLSSFQIYPLLLSFIIFAIDACFRLFVCKNCKEVTSLTSKNFHDNKRGMAINAAFSASPPDSCSQMLSRTSFVFINWMFVVFIVSVTEDSGHWQVGLRQLIACI